MAIALSIINGLQSEVAFALGANVIRDFPLTISVEDGRSNNAVAPRRYTGKIIQLNPAGLGYNRFQIRLETISQLPVTRDVPVSMDVSFVTPIRHPPSCKIEFFIPQGSSFGTAEFMVPIGREPSQMRVNTLIDGEYAARLSPLIIEGIVPCKQSLVHLGDADDFSAINVPIRTGVPVFDNNATYDDILNENLFPNWAVVPNSDLFVRNYNQFSPESLFVETFASYQRCPTDWLEWTTVDTVASSYANLERLTPEQSKALIQHVMSGRFLYVYSNLQNQTALKTTEEWLRANGQAGVFQWENGARYDQLIYLGSGRICINDFENESVFDRLLEIRSEKFLPTSNVATDQVSTALGQSFWNWSLVSMGQPPVLAFCVLIGIFIGVLSPMLIVLCLRFGRPLWLLIVFPIVAITGTISLIGYAIVKDGFQTTSRTRSITYFDKGSRYGTTISRQVVFSGMLPKNGLEFDKDSEVWQIESPQHSSYDGSPGGEIFWTADDQNYRGLLKNREQFQFYVNQSTRDLAPFEWIEKPDLTLKPGEALRNLSSTCKVRNTLSEKIELMVISDGRGNVYLAKEILPDQEVVLQPVDNGVAARAAISQENTQFMFSPPGVLGNAYSSNSFFRTRYAYYSSNTFSRSDKSLEEESARIIDEKTLPQRRCYIIYSSDGKFVDAAVESSASIDSLHLIYGMWGDQK